MANEKQIVLKIETITNQDVMEAYGETLNKVLGSYEHNISELEKYNSLLKDNKAAVNEINNAVKKQNSITDEQIADLKELKKQELEYKQKKSQLLQVLKNEEKIRTTSNGTMANQSQLLGKLRMAWRNMTDEQKKANQGMLQTIQNLDKGIKGADASIGNFQRNVGNYPQLMQQILPVQSKVGQGLMNLAQGAGLSSGALGILGGTLAAGAAAYKVFNDAQKLTQTVGDDVAVKVAGWQAVYDSFVRTLVSGDNILTNWLANFKEIKNTGEEIASMLDELFERNNALRIAESESALIQQERLAIGRDQTKSEQERIKALDAYVEREKQLGKIAKDVAEQEYQARLKAMQLATGLGEKELRTFISQYNERRDVINQYLDIRKKAESGEMSLEAMQEAFEAMDFETRKVAAMVMKYNLANDELTQNFVDAWVKVNQAEANALQRSQRALITRNSLLAKETTKEIKAVKAVEKAYKQLSVEKSNVYINTRGIMDEFAEISDAIDEELTADINSGKLAKVKQSKFAQALGVTDDQLAEIKSQAISAAQSIFSSIQQISQEATQRRLDDQLSAIEDEAESEKAILKAKLDKGVLTQKQYEAKLAEVDAEAEAKREEAKKEAFENQKKWDIAQALMNAALALTNVFATTPTPASFVMAGIVAATTAAQIAAIAAQKYARGGELHGRSHAQGGIKGSVEGHNIELEGDEVVINKRSARKYRKELSYINSDNGWGVDFAGVRGTGYKPHGFKFAQGGVLSTGYFAPANTPASSGIVQAVTAEISTLRDYITATNRRIDRIRARVVVSDITTAQNTLTIQASRANL